MTNSLNSSQSPTNLPISYPISRLSCVPTARMAPSNLKTIHDENCLYKKRMQPRLSISKTPTTKPSKSSTTPSRSPSKFPSTSPSIMPTLLQPTFIPSETPTTLPTSAMSSSVAKNGQLFLSPETTAADNILLRKEIRELSDQELDNYFAALWQYKLNGRRDGRSYFRNYAELVAQHAMAVANSTVCI